MLYRANNMADFKTRILLFSFLFCTVPLPAQVDISLHGSVETLQALPFSTGLDLTDSRNVFTGEISAAAAGAAAFVSFSAEYNGVSPDRGGFNLAEAWVDWSAGDFNLRLGRQLVSWGVADGLILTDVVCPRNLSAYAGLDFAESRLAVDGLRLRYSFPALGIEALWLPLFIPARLPADARNPLYGIFYPSPFDRDGTPVTISVQDAALPRTIADGEYGLRITCYSPAADFSFMGFYGWSDIPSLGKNLNISAPAAVELTPEYDRTVSAGADASVPLGEFLLRLETIWTGNSRYERPAEDSAETLSAGQRDEPAEKHRVQALAGVDWNPSGWSLSVQYYEDLLPDAYTGGTERPWRKNGLSLRIAKGFFRETLNLSAWCYLDLRDFDTSGSVSAGYALTDSLSLSVGGDFFTGGVDNRGSYAAYRDLSCVWFKGVFRF
jgi:hypothetical protein